MTNDTKPERCERCGRPKVGDLEHDDDTCNGITHCWAETCSGACATRGRLCREHGECQAFAAAVARGREEERARLKGILQAMCEQRGYSEVASDFLSFLNKIERSAGWSERAPTVPWRGSVSDLVTDLRALLSEEQVRRLAYEIDRCAGGET